MYIQLPRRIPIINIQNLQLRAWIAMCTQCVYNIYSGSIPTINITQERAIVRGPDRIAMYTQMRIQCAFNVHTMSIYVYWKQNAVTLGNQWDLTLVTWKFWPCFRGSSWFAVMVVCTGEGSLQAHNLVRGLPHTKHWQKGNLCFQTECKYQLPCDQTWIEGSNSWMIECSQVLRFRFFQNGCNFELI